MPNKSAIPILGQQHQQNQQYQHQHSNRYHHHHRQHQQQQRQQLSCLSHYDLLHSARRRLQCSQLPVRNSAREQQEDYKLTNSLQKFQVLGVSGVPRHSNRRSGNTSARKSLSMVDLSPARNYGPSESCSESYKSSARIGDGENRCTELTFNLNVEGCPTTSWTRESWAASIICRALVINSWRRRRVEVVQLRDSLVILEQSFQHFKIQIVVLRRLLDNENGRVATLAEELYRNRAHADEIAKERDHLKTEKEAVEGEVQKYREIAEDRLVLAENLRNELCNLRDQVNLLDKQIERDREKLLKSTEDKKVLLEKVSSSEALAAAREECLKKAESSLEEMQIQLSAQIDLTTSLQEKVQQLINDSNVEEQEKWKLKKLLENIEKENKMMKEFLQSREESVHALSIRATDLESQLVKKESRIKQIELICNTQMDELNELRERLLRQSEKRGWSDQVFQLAGSVVHVPRVILRTLTFFTTGMSIII